MEKSKKMYVTAEEAAEMLGVSTGYAYKIIRGLNEKSDSRILWTAVSDIVNIGLHFFLKNVRPYAASCSEA